MRLTPERGFSCVLAIFVFVLEISTTIDLQFKNETTISNDFSGSPSALLEVNLFTQKRLEVPKKPVATVVISSNSTGDVAPVNTNKRILNKGRRRRRKNRKKRKGRLTTPTTASPISVVLDPNRHPSTIANITKIRKRKRKNKRPRNKKLRRKHKQEHNNILEVTTAREGLHPPRTSSNSTISELIRKLNDNPEDNFEDFHLKQENRTLTLSELNGRNVGNLVAPIPVSAQQFPLPFNDNITLHVSVGNATKHKSPSKKYNRCRKNKGGCTQYCNPRGKIKCSCIEGFALAADQKTCLDIDECKANNGGCEKYCVNVLGTYECRCPPGLRLGDDGKSCEDINECRLRNGHGPCQDTCENSHGSYKCSCVKLNGTKLSEDGHSCVDLDECAKDNGGCSHTCINTVGRAFCVCPDGMELSSDWRTCQDINECEIDEVKRSCRTCVDLIGSYYCLDWMSDYQSDPTLTSITCEPLFPPPKGFISCSRDGASLPYSKTGRKRTTNSPGTSCSLVCPTGYRIIGQFHVVCGYFGRWEGRRDGQCIHAQPPKLECPPSQFFATEKKSQSTTVTFSSPKTNINWRYVKSYPSWAKNLTGVLKEGRYDIHFTVKDPATKLTSSCSFKIFVG